jgi:dTDP-D-glucose 4,6-dehydratase
VNWYVANAAWMEEIQSGKYQLQRLGAA